MTNNQLTDERIKELMHIGRYSYHVVCGREIADICTALEELQERRKADSEPVVFTDERNLHHIVMGRETSLIWGKQNQEAGDIALYRRAQPAPDREQVRREHAEWSQATFGNVGPVGPLKHLSKEALEAAAEPGDLSEWADMQFLLWDAQRRAGITDEQITQAMIEKLAVNKLREWPEPKDGEPRLHIKEQPAPVVPEDNDELARLAEKFGAEVAWANEPNEFHHLIEFTPPQFRAAMLQAGNSPAIPGWIPVSERLPAVGHKVLAYRPDAPESDDPLIRVATYVGKSAHGHGFDCYCKPTHWMPLPAAPQEVKGE
ncbi:TPA: DUF550 domain-containing protein [Klebsiella oxytoca]|nr:DUF550 domain-containing protein [Klebsiella oxytoca]